MILRHGRVDNSFNDVLQRVVMRRSGDRIANNPIGMPTVELHTTGRTSGRRRSTLLTSPVQPEVTAKYKNDAAYQRRTDRAMPVVICERL